MRGRKGHSILATFILMWRFDFHAHCFDEKLPQSIVALAVVGEILVFEVLWISGSLKRT